MFKGHKTVQRVEGWGGVFKMVGISDSKKDSVTALMKILGDKFKYQCKLGEDSFGYNALDGIKIEYVEGSKLIAGFECKKALGKFKDQVFELYYTEDIKIKNANWNTPFKDIKGVLMEYQISMFNINTKIQATELEKIAVDDTEFEIPEGYKSVDKKKIEESVYKFM
jgi:GLPGLI family protein